MALRARALSTVNLENAQLPGKQMLAGKPATRGLRSALGEVSNVNKIRNASNILQKDEKAVLKQSKPSTRLSSKEKDKENASELVLPSKKKQVLEPELEPMETSVNDDVFMDEEDVHDEKSEIEDIDAEDVGNPQLVVEYVTDIYLYLRQLEREQSVQSNYLEGQQVILPKMRAVLIDWLVGVHLQFHLLQETLYTTVAILDRYLQKRLTEVPRSKLQLVGVAAMFIAAKYEEIYAPEVKDFVYITDRAYTEKEILRMELNVLRTLDFDLGRPLPLHFLRRASKAGGVEAATHTLAKYIMELSVCQYNLCSEPPSRLAAAALALSIRLLEPATTLKGLWTPTLAHYTRYSLSDISSTIQKLSEVILAAPTAKLTAIYQKYSNKKFMKIARIPVLDGPVLKNLADGKLV